ncbi:MAG TPA: class I SAM-dependent methyltransferase [Kofleriaceae bacterium]|nr:class I SAM-dependent methyltransferase [Kofleriaceae bacterium]
MDSMVTPEFFTMAYAASPPWDIGRPQRALVTAFDELQLSGSALDLGCGTGEHVLELARRGVDAWGIDTALPAIEAARGKAAERGLPATFVHGDALALAALGRRFDTVIDCGFFHMLSDEDRSRCVAELPHVLAAGGRLLMLGFATIDLGHPPRGYSPEDLRSYFAGFREVFIRPAAFELQPGRLPIDEALGGMPAWVSLFERT